MLLGLDIGTSLIKATLFDEEGCEVAATVERMSLLPQRAGWYELDGEATWVAACRVIRTVTAGTGGATIIRGVGVTGVMVGTWLVDADGALVRPPILWNDARARDLVDRKLAVEPALLSKVFAHSGSVMQLGCTLPVLAWLKENEPDHLARTAHILCAKDFIRFRLTSEIATDESEAAMAPGSATLRDFHPGQAALLGVEAEVSLLAPVRRAETIAGRITAAASEATGLKQGTPVAVGTGDTGSCVIGAGCHEPGQAATVLGTTCLNGVLFDRPVFEPRDLGLLFILPGQRWMKTMVNVAGTTVLDWCLSALCPDIAAETRPYEALGALAESGEPGAKGVVFVPYLSASGVIAPRIEPRARAGLHGLAPHHGRADLVRSIYEGMAYAIRDCFADIGQPQSIRLSGGGARSPFWSQMIADISGIPLEVPEGTQFGTKGAALCAAVAIGDFGSIGEACRATYRRKRLHEPRPREAYEAGFRRFKAASAAALGPLALVAN